GGTRKRARRNLLVAGQIAASTLVLIGMGLCQRSLANEQRAALGFSARNLITAQVPVLPSEATAVREAKAEQFREGVRTAVAAIPGVEAVTFASSMPLMGFEHVQAQAAENTSKTMIGRSFIDPDYFSTLGIPVLRGRNFDSTDGPRSL